MTIYGQDIIDGSRAPADEGRDDHELDALLAFLRRDRGFDFSGHKRSGLTRRVRRRMSAVGIDSLAEYLAYLEQTPDERARLFDLLLINVTAFFRDPPAWHALAARLPSIVDLRADTPVRVWSAGCSSGEEPYTLAMVLCEALGAEAFARRVKIYATDIDDASLAVARLATYARAALESVPEPLIAKYFTHAGAALAVSEELRRAIVFARHDLLQDAPIPHIDVLACRNALMYFNTETQERLLGRLHFALKPSGVLLLGRAEMLLPHSSLFVPVDLKLRLFARAPKSAPRTPRRPPLASTARAEAPRWRDANEPARAELRPTSPEADRVAQVVDADSRVASADERASRALRRAHLELEVTHEKLRAARREVQGMNEELRETNEELETTNEELRAMNEQLRVTNEELEATNEELQAINAELRQRGTELNEAHALFGAVMRSVPVGIAVLDRELRVFAWSARMIEIFAVHPRDAEGQLFESLDIGLPVRAIAASLRAALEAEDESTRTIDGKSPRGDTLSFRVRVSPLRGEHIRGVIVLVEEVG